MKNKDFYDYTFNELCGVLDITPLQKIKLAKWFWGMKREKNKKCLQCGKKLSDNPYSKRCKSCVQIGKQPFLGKKHTDEYKEMMRKRMIGENNPVWRGDQVTKKSALHGWIVRQLGQAKLWECSYCGSIEGEKGRIEWANVSQTYQRDINDFIPLCLPCHRNYDRRFGKEANLIYA